MYGYATNETSEYMPLTVVLSHNLNKKMAELRRDGTLAWLRPDSKSQVCARVCESLIILITMKIVVCACSLVDIISND